ncbi:hypothetical protein IDH44_09060 [Paenibacillus sp. IB182496]|uniref:Uncharacterized protein n=1 Tax=Paenibacillus sabuli TaxID=2772509 RepID=A0A927BRC3_9BACL|nr:hypothetical protein [Paenibacillus sabuli]MBD2845338.1 hypothetical protein [Paenibacillus sabuli]
MLTEALDLFEASGVKAWWYSAAAKGSYPLFKSNVLPYREDADTEMFKWLSAECRKRGISLFSWEYLNTAPLVTLQHPEWRYRYLDWDQTDNSLRDSRFVCHNSPYGELLEQPDSSGYGVNCGDSSWNRLE